MGKSGTSNHFVALAVPPPDLCFGLSRVDRRFVQISSHVQKCLDRPNAWFSTGVPNVPPRVLEGVIARYDKKTRLGTRKGKERVSRQPASPASIGRAAFSSQPATPVYTRTQVYSSPPVSLAKRTSTQHKAKPDDDNGVVSSGTPIPWTPSPPSHFLPVNRQRELATAARTTTQDSSQQAGPPTAGNRSSRAVFLTDFPPSSSQTSETGLEVEVPRAITDVIEPVNRQAVHVLEPTPPSAHIIPSTIAEETNPVQQPEATRRRRMKNPAAVFAELDSVSQSHAPGGTVPKAGTTASSRLSVEDRRHSTTVHQSVVTTIPQPVSDEVVSGFADKVPPNSPPSNVPFTAFKLAYPDYQATLKDFIRAVKCLLKYQKDRALPEFLYDDFIRVFCGDYLAYIRSLGDDQTACPALRWYNDNVSRPLYVSCVVNKKNLTEIPNQYPEEFRAIQQGSAASGTRGQATGTRQIGQRPAVDIETTPVLPHDDLTSTAASLDAEVPTHKAAFSSNAIHTAESLRPMQDSRKILSQIDNNANVPAFPPTRKADFRTEGIDNVTNNTTSTRGLPQSRVDSSLPVFETPQAPRVVDMKRKVASTLPSTILSQISNHDSIPEMATKRKLAPRASAGSSAVEAGAVFKRPRKATEDLEKRNLRFKKFLMQRRMQGSTPQGSKQS